MSDLFVFVEDVWAFCYWRQVGRTCDGSSAVLAGCARVWPSTSEGGHESFIVRAGGAELVGVHLHFSPGGPQRDDWIITVIQ